MSGVLFEGTLYANPTVGGVQTGRVQLPGIAKLAIKLNSELVEQTSKDKGKYGQITASVAIAKPAELSVAISDITPQAFAMAMQGEFSTFSQGSGTITDEVVTAKLGKYVELSKRNISDTGFVVTNSGATVTYVLGTDYNVNYVQGWLEILATGAITDAQSLKVDFSYGAIAGTKVKGSTLAQFKSELMLDGINKVDGTAARITIWDATLTADGEIDFMSDKLVELSMKGRMATPTGKDSPFEIDYGQILS